MKSHLLPRVRKTIRFALILPLFVCVLARGEEKFNSHEVHSDGTITFRYKDPAAKTALLHLDGAKPFSMEKNTDGVWTFVTSPLPPEIYGYIFEVDGQYRLDPANPVVKPNLLYLGNTVSVPGQTAQLWEARNVPHGEVHHHFYSSKMVSGLVDGQSDYFVYTPPDYDAKKTVPYPVLYLLHGWSDMANAWTEVGKANFIFDNLIAAGKMKPMVVVMPLAYGDMKFVLGGNGGWDDEVAIEHNVDLFSQALFTEVMPQVETEYRVSKDRNDRAITGLSMGGLESLTIGLTHGSQFGWVGGFSSALGHHDDERFAMLSAKNSDLRLLWIACGTDEELITPNRKFIASLKAKSIPVTYVETPGMHTWQVWRDNLEHFAPLLFQGK
jgi:enterochelin esterase family protein